MPLQFRVLLGHIVTLFLEDEVRLAELLQVFSGLLKDDNFGGLVYVPQLGQLVFQEVEVDLEVVAVLLLPP